MPIAYHAALSADWAAARESGSYLMSTRGVTLDQEGFIHCSTRQQVEGVANRYYDDVDELCLLTIELDAVGSEVRWEPPAPEVDDLYPHIYGPLPVSAVTAVTTWRRGTDGWVFPAD